MFGKKQDLPRGKGEEKAFGRNGTAESGRLGMNEFGIGPWQIRRMNQAMPGTLTANKVFKKFFRLWPCFHIFPTMRFILKHSNKGNVPKRRLELPQS